MNTHAALRALLDAHAVYSEAVTAALRVLPAGQVRALTGLTSTQLAAFSPDPLTPPHAAPEVTDPFKGVSGRRLYAALTRSPQAAAAAASPEGVRRSDLRAAFTRLSPPGSRAAARDMFDRAMDYALSADPDLSGLTELPADDTHNQRRYVLALPAVPTAPSAPLPPEDAAPAPMTLAERLAAQEALYGSDADA